MDSDFKLEFMSTKKVVKKSKVVFDGLIYRFSREEEEDDSPKHPLKKVYDKETCLLKKGRGKIPK